MESNKLLQISKTSKLLEQINHPDTLRISKEICEFTKYNSKRIGKIIHKMANGMPWEYIKGYTEFDGCKIYLNRNTLIPRLETLQILEIVKEFKGFERIVDIGCGSGAIGIALAKRYPKIDVTLLDISNKALNVAKKNVDQNLIKNAKTIHSNLINNVSIKNSTLIIANLPYIPTNEYLVLEESVKDFEPRLALDGGIKGLKYIDRLLKSVLYNRNIVGAIFEIDPSQEEDLKKSLKTQGRFKFKFYKDFRGLLRFLKLYL